EHELISHDEEHETFYTVFAALAADHISANVGIVWRSQIGVVTQASRILLQYLLGRLQAQMALGEKSSGESETVQALSAKQLLLPIKALCSGFSTLTLAEETTLASLMKNSKLPSHVAASLSGDKDSSPKEAKRSRTDLSSTILERLAMPMHDFAKPKQITSTPVVETSNKATDATSATAPDAFYDIESVFVMKNVATLQALRAGDLLLDMCLSLPHLSRYIHKYREAILKKALSLPSTHSEATLIRHSLQALVSDLSLAWSVVSLPVLEPLSPEKLEKLSTLTTSCLYAAVCVATASCVLGITAAGQQKCTGGNSAASKVEEDSLADSLSITVVEKALDMFNLASTAIKNSSKAGGHIHQNHLLIGVWVLITGLQTQLSASSSLVPEKSGSSKDDKGKSPSKVREGSNRINLMKVQQGFGVLSVALTSRALTMMSTLLEDLQIEGSVNETSSEHVTVEPAGLSILGNYNALNRAAQFLSAAPLNQLLYYVATISYRKACSLKRIQKHPPEGDNFSTSDSTTYYEDDLISCSEESSGDDDDDDDDSEPILGLWFEETVSVPDSDKSGTGNQNTSESQENKAARGADGSSNIVPDKGEPNGYISLATQIFQFMNTYILSSDTPYIWAYAQSGLTEHQMVILAAIVRDLDRETARTETGTISVYFGPTLGQLYTEFSQALARYCHNLLARKVLSPVLQVILLSHLGVSPWAAPVDSTTSCTSWPLQVYPRTLAILAQVLLLKSQQDKEAACINIWHRLINTLVDNVVNPPPTFDVENEDLNVEHAQLLLFLFHSLNLMQKKSVLLITASGVIRCADVLTNMGASSPPKDTQLLHLARLLLLLEYLVKHLYDAPAYLLEQVQWNLFSATSLDADTSDNKDGSRLASRIYVAWSDIENNYRKFGPQDEFSMRPRFYGLAAAEINNQDQPKLDGLACNFILGTPDKLKYPQLIDALLQILSVIDLSVPLPGVTAPNFTALCAMQYCFSISWRLLLLLPPSTPVMDRLALGEDLPSSSFLMYSLVWGLRSAFKTFSGWMKDCLVKQGLFTHYAENLVKTVCKVADSKGYDVMLAKSCIMELLPQVPQGGIIPQELLPRLFDLCLLDTVIARVQVQLDDRLTKPPPSTESPKNSTTGDLVSLASLSNVIDLLPSVLNLTEATLAAIRSTLVFQMNDAVDPTDSVDFRQVLSVASSRSPKTSVLGSALMVHLPAGVRATLEKWNALPCLDSPWNTFANDLIPAESYCLSVINSHVSSLSAQQNFNTNVSLKHLLQSLVTFIGTFAVDISSFSKKLSEKLSDLQSRVVGILVPLTIDACTEYLHDAAVKALEKILGDADSEEHLKTVYSVVLGHVFTLINNYTINNYTDPKNPNRPCAPVDCGILQDCLAFLESLLDKPAGPASLEKFFDPTSGGGDLVKILLSIASPQTAHSPQYGTRVLRFFNRIFAAEEKSQGDSSLDHLCHTISRLATVDSSILETWIRHVVLGGAPISSPSAQVPALLTCTTSIENAQNAANDTLAEAANEQTSVQTTMNVTVPAVTGAEEQQALVQENGLLLQSLTSYMVKERGASCEDAAVALLRAIIPFGAQVLYPPLEGAGFNELMGVMATLADAGTGRGHIDLLAACPEWLTICKEYLCTNESLEAMESREGPSKRQLVMFEACTCLLGYIADVFSCLPHNCSVVHAPRATSPPWEGESPPDIDADWADDIIHEDEDSSAEDSDEDSLCSKLCTYTITQKEFMNQHWYHCHTCKMVDRVGVCTVCARVCHRGHDITYAKYGNFFCDCGAKEDGSCQALVKRSPQSSNEQQVNQINSTIERAASSSAAGTSGTQGVEQMLQSSLRRRASSPVNLDKVHIAKENMRLNVLHEKLDHLREPLMQIVSENSMASTMLDLLNNLIPAVDLMCQLVSPVGCHQRCQIAMKTLHMVPKNYEYNDQLMVPTLGSQEGAFENVRMNYSGDQGQTIRQLLSAHMVRRVAMCCLSSPHGKRQHLAVSHEKGKITVLQLSALLKQADASKRKLTLTRLASAPIPFTVLSVTGNQWNEDFLAVCGLKDCHVLTFSSAGSVAEHLVLHPQLETGNFIIRAIWLPGSQTQLALITADFVKIYDLSKDALSPQYYFLVPTGKIRDCTFICTEDNVMHMMLMSSAGYIYSQAMDEESQAKHGPFYVTNTIEVVHTDIRENNGQVCGGGVSIYYSHVLQLLFFSYAQGKSFTGHLQHTKGEWTMPIIFPILLNNNSNSKATTNTTGNSTSGASNGGNKTASQPLCQWSEVPNHPGLVCSLLQSSNNPVILMIKPDSILVQEIKVVPAKAKIMDMVALRHPSSHADHRTTLILLCEDGSLRIYMASMEYTGFWLSSLVQATSPIANLKSTRKKKTVKTVKPSGQISFPVDFFEHCQAMNDVEFGGNDLLLIYNTQQIKHRLNTTGMYVMSTKSTGFTLEITNSDNSLVMTGLRVLLGSQDQTRAPSFIEIFGRSIQTTLTRNRWFDIPFTKEESLQADKKISVVFGPSTDPDGVTMVDSVKVYGKTKDALGWHEDQEENVNPAPSSAPPASGTPTENDPLGNAVSLPPLNPLDRIVSGLLEVLEGCFTVTSHLPLDEIRLDQRSKALSLATTLLTLPTPVFVQMCTKTLIFALHSNRNSYHSYKDHALLVFVQQSLAHLKTVQDPSDLDAEAFYRLVLITRGVAVTRPNNLAKFADTRVQYDRCLVDSTAEQEKPQPDDSNHLLTHMMSILWKLHGCHPSNLALAPVCVPGLTHVEATVHAMVEIIHAFTLSDMEGTIGLAAQMYREMLMHSDPAVSFSAKQAMCRVLRTRSRRRRVYIPSPPHCSTPGGTTEMESEKGPVSQPSQDSSEAEPPHFEVDQELPPNQLLGLLQYLLQLF
ncbi:E3 ubiquitin-protein ligase UBR4, partial [Frankliniella fusca]